MKIKYISSNLAEFDLYGEHLSVVEGNFHEYKWGKSDHFTKKPLEYNLVLQLRGSLVERKEILNRLTDAFEHDVQTEQCGTLVFGDWSIGAFATVSSSGISRELASRSEREVRFVCPTGFWVKKIKSHFQTEKTEVTGAKRYPYNYPYRYNAVNSSKSLINSGVMPCDFKAWVYGPRVNPSFQIAGNRYLVNVNLSDGERMEIDTSVGTVYKFLEDGKKINIFHLREKTGEFFKKVPPGINQVSWSGQMNFEVELRIERSEPEW